MDHYLQLEVAKNPNNAQGRRLQQTRRLPSKDIVGG